MPVNKDPSKRRRPQQPAAANEAADGKDASAEQRPRPFGEETDQDREKDAADAEWKNLWDATEVIDMDKW